MSALSSLILPVKDPSTGTVTQETFTIGGGFISLEANMAANATSVSFTNAAITNNATYDVHTSNEDAIYRGMSISGTTATLYFRPVKVATIVQLRIS